MKMCGRPRSLTDEHRGEFKHGGRLSAAERHNLPSSDFALPGERYPVNDENHARNALARVSQFGTASEKAAVRRKVSEKYPDIGKK
jgi:hypothetical protein